MIKNNPVRCATPGCAFYAVVLGGFCEDCEAVVFAPAAIDADEAEWIDFMHAQNEIESREAQWAAEIEAREAAELFR